MREIVLSENVQQPKVSRKGFFLNSGNRCGHDPDSPLFSSWQRPETQKPLPETVQNVINGVKIYYSKPKVMPVLCFATHRKRTKTGKARQNRSEAREAEVLMLMAVYSRTDWASLRVGIPLSNGKFKPLSHLELAKIMEAQEQKDSEASDLENGSAVKVSTPAKFTRQSASGKIRPNTRYWSAFWSLTRAGAWESHKRYHVMENGDKRAKVSIKLLNLDFIVALTGTPYHKLQKLRDYASSAVKKRRQDYTDKNPGHQDQNAALTKLLSGFYGRVGATDANLVKKTVKPQSAPRHQLKPKDQEAIERSKEICAYQVKLAADGVSRERILQLVKDRYPDYG